MAGEGMVAVMQGLRDCGLAVALLDEDGKTYTLVPKVVERKTTSTGALPNQCDAGAQATDGRYATVYKVHHCKVTPTSPPDDLPEFPPQRAEIYPGQGNFEVGGTGSTETYIPVKSSCYRGGMCWSDRGSVCTPRPSRDPDAFANSLRKYPISPDRSSEMVERLVNYSQHNCNRPHRHYSPPCRTCDHVSNSSSRSSRHGHEPEVFVARRRSPEEHPTRERRAYEAESYRKPTFSQNSDMRAVREISRRLKDSIKSMSLYVEAPISNPTRGNNEFHPAQSCFRLTKNQNPNFVNTEIQAAASMVSRKVATVPQPQPIKRTVAIPLSPAPSISRNDETGNVSIAPSISRSVQTIDKGELSVHTATSYTDVTNKVMVTRKSKSFSDFAIDKDLKTDILKWLDDDSDPKVKAIHDSVLRKLNSRLNKIPGVKVQRKEVKDNLKERIADQLHRLHSQSCYICKSADAIRNETNDIAVDKNKDNVIKEWVNDISAETRDMLRPVIKEQVYNTFVRRLKQSAANKTTFHREQAIRSEILVLLDDVPIDCQGLSKRIYLNTLVDALITKLDNISGELSEDENVSNRQTDEMTPQSSKYYSESSVKERKLEPAKTATKTIINALREAGTDFSDILTHSNNENHSNKDNCKGEVAAILNNVTKLSEDKGVEFAMYLKENVKGKLIEKRLVIETQPKTVLLVQDVPKVKFRATPKNVPKVNDRNNLEYLDSSRYLSQLTGQIEEWLSNLKIAQKYDKALRKSAVNDLANDIIDRQKYMEMSSNSCSDIVDVEHLKYQIFKWINKLVGEDNTETIEHASELMQRIKNIPVSVVNTHDQETTTKCDCRFRNPGKHNKYGQTHEDKSGNVPDRYRFMAVNRCVQTVFTASNSQFNICGKAGSSGSKNNSDLVNSSNVNTMSSCCPGPPQGPPSLKQLNDEFEAFVANWVKEIPIESNTPQEAAMAERARLGIENGVWKAITKMKFEPATFHNKFLYEDVLEEEIDALLDILSQTPELQQKRHLLKVKLIEKTSEINEKLLDAGMPASFKQQLAQQVASNLPRRAVIIDEQDPNKLFEEMLILCIADDFILSTRYKDEDKVKANAYRNKVIRKIEAIIDEVKRTSGKEVKDFDSELCVNDVISALHKVPLPTEETIKQEADEILLGLEIEQWFNNLPIVKNDERTEQLHRRRLRDALTKKLHEMEKEVNIADCTGEPQFKHEISMFLEKLPLEKDESLNINFMVDELANRMKNREKGNRRKSVSFMDGQQQYGKPQAESTRLHASQGMQQPNMSSENLGHEFNAFTQDVPACSSMINSPPEPRNYHEPATDHKKCGIDSNQSQKWYSFDSKGNPKESSTPVYVPGQFQEETLGGRFGYGPQGQIPLINQRNFNPDSVNHGSTMGSFLENQCNIKSSTPYQQKGPSMNYDQPNGYHSYPPPMNPAMGSMYGQQMPRSDMPSGEFVSLLHDSNPPPMPSFVPTLPRDCSQRSAKPPVASFVDDRSANQGPAMGSFFDNQGNLKASTSYQQKPDPYMSHMAPTDEFVSLPYASNPPMPNFGPASQTIQPSPTKNSASQPPAVSFVGGFESRPDISQNQPRTYQGASNFTMPELPSYRRHNEPLPQYGESEFSSLHDSKMQFAPRSPGQSSQRAQFDSHEGSGFNNTCKNCSQYETSPPIAEQSVQPPQSFAHHLDATQQGRPNVTQADGSTRGPIYSSVNQSNQGQTIDPNRSTNVQMTNQDSIQQKPQNGNLPQPLVTVISASNRDGSTYYGQDARFLAPNQSTGLSISNQPAGFSTPNQPVRNAQPPNIKKQRQIEKKSRVDSGTDDEGEEVRVRCQCVERYNRRCKKRPLFTCDAWSEYPLHFPMGCVCTHPYFFNGR